MRRAAERALRWIHRVEDAVAVVSLLLVALVPTLESFTRLVFRTGIRSSTDYVQHLVIWVTFAGGLITSRENRHLALTAGVELLREPHKSILGTFTASISSAVTAYLAVSSWQFLSMAFDTGMKIGFVPVRIVMIIVPVGYAMMAVRMLVHAPARWYYRLAACAAPVAAVLVACRNVEFGPAAKWPLVALLVMSGAVGAPIFTVLGGIAVVMFLSSGGSTAIMANETYTMLTGPVIPTIPLFALTGFILSESKAGERLVAFFRAACGWMPGGLAVMAVVVCAFFTTFTGASGVTILALGGLLSYVLTESRYDKGFTTGLLTASGSIGLLFPPSLPIILYGVIAHVNIKHLFVAGLVPGVMMMMVVALFGIHHARNEKVPRIPFDRGAFFTALRAAAWELALPIAILVLYLRGITTLVETSAMSVLYALVIVVFVHRDTRVRDIPGVMLKCLSTVGGILVILGVARGLSYYIVDAEVPGRLTEWCSLHIGNKYLFLALLNVVLLLTGCLMDIFSAVVVVVPLVVPLAETFGVDPIHLGIIFLANLELGYLTPPVGINLFLAAYRFEIPLSRVYRHVTPFLIALGIAVLVITYVPWLTTGLLSALHIGN